MSLNSQSGLCIYLILTRHEMGIQQSFDEIKPTVSPERREAFTSHMNGFLKTTWKVKAKNKQN